MGENLKAAIDNYRKQKDLYFKQDPHSPLLPEQKDGFEGLSYYEYDPAFRYEVRAEEFNEQEVLAMQTSTGKTQDYIRWGQIYFEVGGEAVALTLYIAMGSGGYFMPFMDATNGEETYSAGRYLEVDPLPDDRFIVDFNLTYNPYCAYTPSHSLFERMGQTPRML